MNQKRWSGLTATVMVASLSLIPISRAEQSEESIGNADLDWYADDTPLLGTESEFQGDSIPSLASRDLSSEVVKVGTPRSQVDFSSQPEIVAHVLPHHLGNRQAATVYVRNIPVLTFLAANSSQASQLPQFESDFFQQPGFWELTQQQGLDLTESGFHAASNLEDKLDSSDGAPGSTSYITSRSAFRSTSRKTVSSAQQSQESALQDPVWRATSFAAFLNYLYHDGLSQDSIDVYWDESQWAYVIYIGEQAVARIDDVTLLPDTTDDREQDALQVANRLRRLLDNGPPLRKAKVLLQQQHDSLPLEPVDDTLAETIMSGWASWYGPGFHGGLSASGEVFNQNEMTAAHRWLPFGTQVRVTNLYNGRSVVVRINDRGPYVGGRVIDLSARAAHVLGMIHMGIAPIQMDILDEGVY